MRYLLWCAALTVDWPFNTEQALFPYTLIILRSCVQNTVHSIRPVQYEVRSLYVWYFNSQICRSWSSTASHAHSKTLVVTQQWQIIHLHKYRNLGKLLSHIMCVIETSNTWKRGPELASKGTVSLPDRWIEINPLC